MSPFPALPLRRGAALILALVAGLVAGLGAAPAAAQSAGQIAPAAQAGGATPVLRIARDPGGEIGVRLRHLAHLRDQGAEVRIMGECHSACTLSLGLDTACVSPQARLGFHGPRPAPGHSLTAAETRGWTETMAAHYPEPLRGWFLARMAEDPEPLRVLRGADLIRAGVPACA